jgi:hypothetical protein
MIQEHKHGPIYVGNFVATWAANVILLRRTNATDNAWIASSITIRQTVINNAAQNIVVEVVNPSNTVTATQSVNLPANTTLITIPLNNLAIPRNYTLVVRGTSNNSNAPANVDVNVRLL